MRGLLLDLDGVLCDSLPALRFAYRRFLEEAGATPTDAEFESLNGPPLTEIVLRLKRARGLAGDPAQLLLRYRALVADAHASASPAEGAAEVLAQARRMGWRLAVVTSAPEASAAAWLQSQGLGGLIDALIHGEAVSRGKPDPEPYLTAAASIGCAPQRCLAVEDSEQGASAALAAGVRTLFLGAAVPQSVQGHTGFAGRLERFCDLANLLSLSGEAAIGA
jgi:HAD superfamily hydrolase (TIGR01509 family)